MGRDNRTNDPDPFDPDLTDDDINRVLERRAATDRGDMWDRVDFDLDR